MNVKSHVTSMSCTPKPAIQSCENAQRIPFIESRQLTTTENTDGICLGLQAGKRDISHSVTWRDGRTILSQPKFLGCMQPNFITHGATLRALRARESSAKNKSNWVLEDSLTCPRVLKQQTVLLWYKIQLPLFFSLLHKRQVYKYYRKNTQLW